MKASNSKIQCYKTCRRMYELKYVHGMRWLGSTEALEQGKSYHALLAEVLLKSDESTATALSKTKGMVRAFEKWILPQFEGKKVVECERYFEYKTKAGHTLFGYLDGVFENGELLEHKTTSSDVDGNYRIKLENDEQTMCYLLATGQTSILYTMIKKPTIRQKKGETDEDFEQRCVDWYEEDTCHKIDCQWIEKTQEELSKFEEELDSTLDEMEQQKLFFKCPTSCNKFGRMCEYFPLCNNFNENESYMNFVKYDEQEKDSSLSVF